MVSIGTKREAEQLEDTMEKRQRSDFESSLLLKLPSEELYEKSYMHKEEISHIVTSIQHRLIYTASIDGVLKIWRKKDEGIEFVKGLKGHKGAFSDAKLNANESRIATCSETDKLIKLYDVGNFDLMQVVKLNFLPSSLCFVTKQSDFNPKIAIAEKESGSIKIIDLEKPKQTRQEIQEKEEEEGENTEERKFSLHRSPVKGILYSNQLELAISFDQKSVIQVWDPQTFSLPTKSSKINFSLISETDFLQLARSKTKISSCFLKNRKLVVYSADSKLVTFDLVTGKALLSVDLTPETLGSKGFTLPPKVLEKKIAQELKQATFSMAADEDENLLFVPALQGVLVISLETGETLKCYGLKENHLRVSSVSLFLENQEKKGQKKAADPLVLVSSSGKKRFYFFSNRAPLEAEEGKNEYVRDIQNEKSVEVQAQGVKKQKLGERAYINTSYGEIIVKLYPQFCPKTVENFCELARKGYYDNLTFHRVIKAFMIQTGDPSGDGTGGQSIWGKKFQDEFTPVLSHKKPFMLSMANAGPNTNGSQFFITSAPAPWLDNKHTIFGEVEEGQKVVREIECVKTDSDDKPLLQVKLLSVKIV